MPFRLDEHLARLERSLGEAKIRNPHSRAQWRSHIYQLIDAQPFDDQGVYFQVTRGVAKRDHAFPKSRRADGVHDGEPAGQSAAGAGREGRARR